MRHALIVLALVACAQQPAAPDEPAVTSRVESFDWPGIPPTRVDVLVVLDDTAEMAPYVDRTQAMLRSIDALWPAMPWSTRPDLHVAVTTADPAGAGTVRMTGTVQGAYLIDEHTADGGRRGNYTGSFADALAALGAVGTAGEGSTPLDNARAAAEGTPGFLRDDAYLAIVIVSAHDDASQTPVDEVVTWAKGMKADPTEVVVAVVAPATAPRLDAMVAGFPNRATRASIDDDDYAPAVAILSQLLKIALGAACIAEPLDVDLVADGPQYDCQIEIVQEDGVVQVVPPCPSDLCWQFVADPQNCTETGGGEIEIPPYRWWRPMHVRGQCVVGE